MSAIELRTPTDDAEAWIEYDGRWSAFTLQAGNETQNQNFRFLPSMLGYIALLPLRTELCESYQRPLDACSVSQGFGQYGNQQIHGYMGNRSNTYDLRGSVGIEVGSYAAGELFGSGYDVATDLGIDVLRVQNVNSTWLPGRERSPILSAQSELFSVVTLGIGFGNFTFSDVPYPSFTKVLSDAADIPSRSWGFTAGASYGNNGIGARGSLVLGGYDATQFEAGSTSTFSIPEGVDGPQSLVVDVSGIRIGHVSGTTRSSSDTPFKAVIDSTLPYLYLPNETFNMFVEQFNLVEFTVGNVPNLWAFNASSLAEIRSNTSDITFFIKDAADTANTDVQTIKFPFDAFDVPMHWSWGAEQGMRIFPIRRQQHGTLAVLGRAFMQEAYIHANFEPDVMKFNLSQRAYPANGIPSDIQTVLATPPTIIDNSSDDLARGAVAGIVIGSVAGAALILFSIWSFLLRRRRAKAKVAALAAEKDANRGDPFPMIDSEAGSDSRRATETGTWLSEIDGTQSSYAASLLRPRHGRHESYASELSSDSDHERTHAKMLMATLHERHELEGNQADERMKLAGGSAEPSPKSSPRGPAELPASTEWPLLDANTNGAPKPDERQQTTDEPAAGTQTHASLTPAPATPAATQQPGHVTPTKLESRFQEAVDTEPSRNP